MISKVSKINGLSNTVKTFSLNISSKSSENTVSKSQALSLEEGVSVLKTYAVNGDLYLYLSDNKVYKLESGTLTSVSDTEFSNTPELVLIYKEGIEKLLIYEGENSVIVGTTEQEVALSDGDCCSLFGMTVIAKNNTVKFSAPFDGTDFSTGINEGGYITLPSDSGDIIKVLSSGDKVVAVCKYAVYQLDFKGEKTDYSLTKLITPFIEVKENSVVKIGEIIYFVSNNKVYSIKEKTVSFFELKNNLTNTVINSSGCFDGYFAMCYEVSGVKYLLAVDTELKSETLLTGLSCISNRLGYAVNESENKLYKLTLNCFVDGGSISSNLNCNLKKTVLSLSGKVVGSATLVISGEFGSKSFNIKDGTFFRNCKLASTDFSFLITDPSSDFSMSEITITYFIN